MTQKNFLIKFLTFFKPSEPRRSSSSKTANSESAPVHYKDRIFNIITFIMSLVPAIIVLAIAGFLIYYAMPAIEYNGLGFFQSINWYPGNPTLPPVNYHGILAPANSSFGALAFIYGTLLTSALALLFALPISYFVSLTVELYLPVKIKKFLISLIELFAGIPSVVYGFWGVLVLIPLLYKNVEPAMSSFFSKIPYFSHIPILGPALTGPVISGYGVMASAIILTVMILPIITSVMTNSIDSTPNEIKYGVYSLGATRWELGKYLLNKHSVTSTFGGALLGLGRALGETMAVLMVSGALINALPVNLYSTTYTMAAFIAAALDSAFFDTTGMNIAALCELGIVLMAISLVVSVFGRMIAGRGVLRGYQND